MNYDQHFENITSVVEAIEELVPRDDAVIPIEGIRIIYPKLYKVLELCIQNLDNKVGITVDQFHNSIVEYVTMIHDGHTHPLKFQFKILNEAEDCLREYLELKIREGPFN
jgi:hypothetical protein